MHSSLGFYCWCLQAQKTSSMPEDLYISVYLMLTLINGVLLCSCAKRSRLFCLLHSGWISYCTVEWEPTFSFFYDWWIYREDTASLPCPFLEVAFSISQCYCVISRNSYCFKHKFSFLQPERSSEFLTSAISGWSKGTQEAESCFFCPTPQPLCSADPKVASFSVAWTLLLKLLQLPILSRED